MAATGAKVNDLRPDGIGRLWVDNDTSWDHMFVTYDRDQNTPGVGWGDTEGAFDYLTVKFRTYRCACMTVYVRDIQLMAVPEVS